jgi:hypothetical protein
MWTEEQIKYLSDNYINLTNKELSNTLSKSERSIERKLSNLGLKRGWRDYEIKYLQKVYEYIPNDILSTKLNKSVNSIISKAQRLNLYKDGDKVSVYKIRKKSKYVCEECDEFGTNSLKGLSIHLSKKHLNIDHKEYYLNYLGSIENCYFCGESGKFIDFVNGFRNLCESNDCLSKSRNSHSIETFKRKGYSDEESISIIGNSLEKQSISGKHTVKNRLKKDPLFTKKKSPNCKEFYLERGYSEKESVKKSSKVVRDMQNVSHKKRKENPYEYSHTYNTKKEYYIERGYSEEQSLELLSERQTTFSKEICIEKYGEKEGLRIWEERQDKWLKTMDSKTEEEKIEINKKKLFNNSGYSKISNELFDCVFSHLNIKMKNKSYYQNNNGELIRYDQEYKRCYRLDFTNTISNKCIEFNGDFWHCNPAKYNENYTHNILKRSAKEIWEYDNQKNNFIKDKLGFDLLIIWESDYRKNKKETIQKCIDFLKK